jgi:hypothetical protein
MILLLLAVSSSSGQSDDLYSLGTVTSALSLRSGGRIVVLSVAQRRLSRLGDGTSIALLKILDEQELTDPARIRDYLPLIEASFAEPKFIANESDRQPRVTLLLLNHIAISLHDDDAKAEVAKTIDFVTERTGRSSKTQSDAQ